MKPERTPSTRIRGRKGQELRKRRLLRTDYLCEMCQAEGIMRLADEVDHIIPLAKGGKDIDENTQNLCRSCHDKKTRKDFGYKEKPTFGSDGWPVE